MQSAGLYLYLYGCSMNVGIKWTHGGYSVHTVALAVWIVDTAFLSFAWNSELGTWKYGRKKNLPSPCARTVIRPDATCAPPGAVRETRPGNPCFTPVCINSTLPIRPRSVSLS